MVSAELYSCATSLDDWMRYLLAAVLGVATSVVFYFLLVFGVLAPIQQSTGDDPEAWGGAVFFIVMPFSLFVGGVLTGYVARKLPKPTNLIAGILAPGLYISLWFTLKNIEFLSTFYDFMMVVLLAAIAVVSSAIGVVFGVHWRSHCPFKIEFARLFDERDK